MAKKKENKSKKKSAKKSSSTKRKTQKKKSAPKKTAVSKRGFGSNPTYARVRHVLWMRYKHEFPSYLDFIRSERDKKGNPIAGTSIPSVVYEKCKGKECTDQDIYDIYSEVYHEKTEITEAELNLIRSYIENPNEFWTIVEEGFWIALPDSLYIHSPNILASPSSFYTRDMMDQRMEDGQVIRAGDRYRFQAWVDYLNDLQKSNVWHGKEDDKKATDYPAYRFDDLMYNENEQRWEVSLIPCSLRNPELKTWGWIPELKGFEEPPRPEPPLIDEPPVEPPVTETELKLREIDARIAEIKAKIAAQESQIKLEQEKQKTIQLENAGKKIDSINNVLGLLKDGVITSKEAKEMIKEIKST